MNPALGTWDAVFGPASPELQALALTTRDLIRHLHPETVEVARPGDRAVSFGHGPAKMREAYLYLMPQRAWLNLGFYQGVRLPDPSGLLAGAGKALRHVKLRAVSDLGAADLGPADLGPAVVALVQAAIRCARQPPV